MSKKHPVIAIPLIYSGRSNLQPSVLLSKHCFVRLNIVETRSRSDKIGTDGLLHSLRSLAMTVSLFFGNLIIHTRPPAVMPADFAFCASAIFLADRRAYIKCSDLPAAHTTCLWQAVLRGIKPEKE
ncbi:MAG: hypothetical protein ABSD46_08510 [Bacteroidota bacterium]